MRDLTKIYFPKSTQAETWGLQQAKGFKSTIEASLLNFAVDMFVKNKTWIEKPTIGPPKPFDLTPVEKAACPL